ncbi:MAG TPA: DUF5317 family protein, partial [Actinomycetota bacterium]|nr:DUF5317 family protein [Actinomycetota bacterium]
MFLFVIFVLGILAVPLARGKLSRLAELRIRMPWLLAVALVIQIIALGRRDMTESLGAALHISSYVAGAAFLIFNRAFPGFWLIVLGGGC